MKASGKENVSYDKNAPSFENEFLNGKINFPPLPDQQSCLAHNKPYSNLFCVDCLSYKVCSSCLQECHAGHQVEHYPSKGELVSQTRQVLLQSLQQTLKDLKSRENEVNNRIHEINLVKSSLKTMKQQILSTISAIFQGVEQKLNAYLEQKNKLFEKQINSFFQEFNQTNDDLRDTLMLIIDGNIDVYAFERGMIKKMPPSLPQFQGYKSTLEKFKNLFRGIKQELNKTIGIIEEECQKWKLNKPVHKISSSKSKFDKYIDNGQSISGKVNESFMKTLKLISEGEGKQNQPYLNLSRVKQPGNRMF